MSTPFTNLRPLLSVDYAVDNSIRCHTLPEDWFHATRPSVSEVMAAGSDPLLILMLADKHLLISQSSFEGVATAGDLPMDVFPAIIAELVTAGSPVRADGSCHLDNT